MTIINQIEIENFRGFERTTVSFSTGINMLIGPNNCGKTTVLQALLIANNLIGQLYDSQGEWRKKFYQNLSFLPYSSLSEIFTGGQPNQNRPVRFTVRFSDGAHVTIQIRPQFGSFHLSVTDYAIGANGPTTFIEVAPKVTFVPGLIGVIPNEGFAHQARRDSLASQNRHHEVFRNNIMALHENGEKFRKLNEIVGTHFGLTIEPIEYDPNVQENVQVMYNERNKKLDVISLGAGTQQILQLITNIFLKELKFVLIDEPDAHLHPQLQSVLPSLFRHLQTELNLQMFISTHSLAMIDSVEVSEILSIDRTQSTISPFSRNAELEEKLKESGIVTNSMLAELYHYPRVLVIEDRQQGILRKMDEVLGTNLYKAGTSTKVKPAKGLDNFKSIKDLHDYISQLSARPIAIRYIQDRDMFTDEMVQENIKYYERMGIKVKFIPKHEPENYLIQMSVISKAIASQEVEVAESDLRDIILAAGRNCKPATVRKAIDDFKRFVRVVRQGKPTSGTDEEAIRYVDSIETVEQILNKYPGKELLEEICEIINERYSTNLSQGALIKMITRDDVLEMEPLFHWE